MTTLGMNKKPLTILELFFCISLLALIGSFMIVKSRSVVYHYKSKGEIRRFAKELAWSHKVALTASADIDFMIEKRKDKIYCSRKTDEPLAFERANQHFEINRVCNLFFENKAVQSLKITFTRSGLIIPMGKIRIYLGEKNYEIVLDPEKTQRIYEKEV